MATLLGKIVFVDVKPFILEQASKDLQNKRSFKLKRKRKKMRKQNRQIGISVNLGKRERKRERKVTCCIKTCDEVVVHLSGTYNYQPIF